MPFSRQRTAALLLPVLAVIGIAAAIGAEQIKEDHDRRSRAEILTGGDVFRGRKLFTAYGCGGCHTVSGVEQAHGQVGPPLDGLGGRAIIAGRLANKPDNLMRWIGDPQGVSPGTAMPNLGVTPAQQRDIAAFLYAHS